MSGTFVGMPAFPTAAREALGDTQLRRNLAHATRTIRDKRARVVAAGDRRRVAHIQNLQARLKIRHIGHRANDVNTLSLAWRIITAQPGDIHRVVYIQNL